MASKDSSLQHSCLEHIYDPEELAKAKALLAGDEKVAPFSPSITHHPLITSEIVESLVKVRRHLHTFPEVSFTEHKTARFVADTLRSYADESVLPITEGIGRTGVVAWFYGTGPRADKEDYCVMLRADMDGLPIAEVPTERNSSYISTNGNMHACGHDGHVSMLLHATKVMLSDEFRARLPSNFAVKLCFQPAEEGGGGAKYMVEDGILERTERCGPYVNEVYGAHLWSYIPVGTAMTCYGSFMAASDRFYVTVTGSGGHGAVPNGTKDAIMIASTLVSQFQSIVSRNISPLESAVVTVGTFEAGYSANIIADKATLSGTTRSFNRKNQIVIEQRMRAICQGVSTAYDCDVKLDYVYGYPATCNDTPSCVDRFVRVAKLVLGEDERAVTTNAPPTMGAEDFSFFLNRRPGCYYFIGSCPTDELDKFPHHKSCFDLHEDAFPVGSSVFIHLVEDLVKMFQA